MLRIEKFDEAIKSGRKLKEMGINPSTFWAYKALKETGNELLDFNDVIWEREIPEIVKTLKENNIHEFTISSTCTNVIQTLAEFENYGCTVGGLVKINGIHTDIWTGERDIVSAIKIQL